MTRDGFRVLLCNGAAFPPELEKRLGKALRLEYRDQYDPNVRISLPDFIRNLYHLPDRVLDLLEIASYVFIADRLLSRGKRAAVEYAAWSRSLHFVIKVRDFAFWTRAEVQQKLSASLCFMTGDRAYRFTFEEGHSTPPTSLFDSEAFNLPEPGAAVLLFSGGLDSLCGALDQLGRVGSRRVCLVNHRSQPGTSLTQKKLAGALDSLYPNRIAHYTFDCVLHGRRAVE
jgi:hypothetical protein